MIILFEIGSVPLFHLGAKAKQDSWLAIGVGAAVGLVLLLLLLWLQKRMPEMELTGMLRYGFGRIAGSVAGVLYFCYFAYESMRNVRDIGEMTALTLLRTTPIFITMLIFLLIAGYATWKGAEIIFRLPEILLPGLMLSYSLLIALFFILKRADIRWLLPVAENGLLPIVQAALPDLISFPFGQMIVFLMVWPLWNGNGVPVRNTLWAYAAVSLFLVLMNVLNSAVLGPSLAANSILPLLEASRALVELKFIERLDILVTIMIFVGLMIKILLYFYCAVEILANLTRLSAKWLIVLVIALIYSSAFLERNYTQHIAVGLGPSLKVDLLFQIVIPLVMAVSVALRQHFSS
ncbi:endospore germination permease [Paenibacillus sp. HN-1]|nr:endospore germination permease [Paenibacillus sp. CGMCC 1.18879]MBY9087195.1 endospore germination permease [Paenibacillus sinensis]